MRLMRIKWAVKARTMLLSRCFSMRQLSTFPAREGQAVSARRTKKDGYSLTLPQWQGLDCLHSSTIEKNLMMNIGEAASASGVSAKMIRHYEELGLLPEARRTESGYRQYEQNEVQTLRFIRHARDLGFSLSEIAELVGLWQNRRRPSRQVKALAEAHIKELELKAAELLAMKSALEHLAQCCHGDDRPECPILDGLAGDAAVSNAAATPRAPTRVRNRVAG